MPDLCNLSRVVGSVILSSSSKSILSHDPPPTLFNDVFGFWAAEPDTEFASACFRDDDSGSVRAVTKLSLPVLGEVCPA